MSDLKVIYFEGCPNAGKAINLLNDLGLNFEKIEQTSLPDGNEFKNYSSPTIMIGNKVLFGAKASGGGCSLHLPSLEQLRDALKTL